MAYVEGRIIHDADSHLMELPDCLDDYFDKAMLARFQALPIYRHKLGAPGWAAEGARPAPGPRVPRRGRGQHPPAQEPAGAGRLP